MVGDLVPEPDTLVVRDTLGEMDAVGQRDANAVGSVPVTVTELLSDGTKL